MVVPSVSKQHADSIATFLQSGSHIISHIKVTPVKSCVHRVQDMVTYPFPVDIKLIKSAHGNICPCRPDSFRHREFLSEIRGRLVLTPIVVAYPASFPIVLVHHSGLKRSDV